MTLGFRWLQTCSQSQYVTDLANHALRVSSPHALNEQSFSVVTSLLSTLFVFTSLLAFNRLGLNYIPAGPTSLIIRLVFIGQSIIRSLIYLGIFSIMYQYYRTIPTAYTFRISKLDLSNKIFRYVLAFQVSWYVLCAVYSIFCESV